MDRGLEMFNMGHESKATRIHDLDVEDKGAVENTVKNTIISYGHWEIDH